MSAEVIVSHPPVSITLEHIIELLFETLVVIPCFVLISELTSPLTLAPWVSNSNELEAIDFSDLLNTVSVIEEDTRVTHALFWVTILVLDGIGAPEQETLLVVLLNVFPELATFDCLGSLRSPQVEFLRNTSSEVNESLAHLTSVEHLVSSMQLGVCLLHERHPELVVVSTMAIERGLALSVVWDSGIHDDMLPATVLEELENCKSILDTVIDDQVLQELWVRALNQEGSEEPAVAENTLFNVTRRHLITLHEWLTLWSDFLRSLPLNLRHVDGVLRWISWIVIQGVLVCGELRVSEQSVVISANLNNLLNLVLNWILLGLLLLHGVLLPILHHLLSILLAHLISIVDLLLSQKVIDLLLSQWVAISSNVLLVGVSVTHLSIT